jgi:2-polyprenyl-3-methyl-5-hydroxy-6-metoxy-1,4-benzoquinol methylase
MKQYYIKPGYRAHERAHTAETQEGAYWTPERVRASAEFQWHVYEMALDLLKQKPLGSRRVADVGCGTGWKAMNVLKPAADEIVGFDQPTLAAWIRKNFPSLKFVSIDLDNPDYDGGDAFDLVICADVIEHLVDPDSCMQLISKLTKPDGVIVISTPERDVEHGINCMESSHLMHVREWNTAELKAYVESHGLKVMSHHLLPKKRLSFADEIKRRVAKPFLCDSKWLGCQAIVCRRVQ